MIRSNRAREELNRRIAACGHGVNAARNNVAAACGVSVGALSRVCNGHRGVSPAMAAALSLHAGIGMTVDSLREIRAVEGKRR